MRDLVVGVGCRDGTDPAVVLVAVTTVVDDPSRLCAVATLDRRVADPAIVGAAAALGVPVLGYSAADLAAVVVPTPSVRVAAAVGTASVAEAAAMLGAGGGELLVHKHAHDGVTVALARTV